MSEALEATYWKPIQAGDLVNSDSIKIKNLTENVTVLKEGVKLSQAMSPHAAARIDGVKLGVLDFSLPKIDGNFIVPLNSDGLMIADIIEEFKLPVIIVSRHYLGSINHTLLTVEVLKNRGVVIKGIVFVGQENRDTEEIILSTTGLKMIARIPEVKVITKEFIKEQANLFSLD